MKFLHENQILHLDLKPSSVLINNQLHAQVGNEKVLEAKNPDEEKNHKC